VKSIRINIKQLLHKIGFNGNKYKNVVEILTHATLTQEYTINSFRDAIIRKDANLQPAHE
jgi:hypothetical protein